ncbi:uncharacterized protein C8A04DRAFT_14059 [Dichotomopilus funicola]|uniref:MHYT domain-containing protein n=1 Tax=Dichotomopilus funicola TaxID=1934379 RepID=A0AAN6UYB1_9PEZI|nr:hypothetical protein C8A04DRAFT_14059 [Dichotomopilus funicola]
MGTALAANDRDGLRQYVGEVIPVSFDPGLLVLSYVISLVGAASTLELIHRRTSRRGYYNNLLLLGAAVSMGGVSIWSMHYIGNRATTLLHGEPNLQIAYSVGVTVASFFVPIFVLLVAFFVVTSTSSSRNNNHVSWWRVTMAGTLSGGAISGMHYLGNASISNYRCDYIPAFVASATVIAAVASTVALTLFFVFKSAWTNSWWKRVGCAVVLAGAVSGMHWCAVMGTQYTLLHVGSTNDTSSRNTTVIVTACLSFAACLIMAGLAIYSARVRKGYARRAQRITVAAAVFDEHGNILVTPDGFLPSEVVTSTFLQKMGQHLARLPHTGRNVRTGIELVDNEGHIVEHYDIIFRELFCIAASELARQMSVDLVDVGILWDEILSTGGSQLPSSISEASTSTGSGSLKDDPDDVAEKGNAPGKRSGHGHLMFLVRKVDSSHVDHLAASGYCFAEPRQVTHIIRSKMHIRTHNLEDKLRGMYQYAHGNMLEPGVHLGLFAVRTQVHQMGFDILVKKEARNLLPSIQLPLDRLESANVEFLQRLEGMTLGALHRRLERAGDLPPKDAQFAGYLLEAIRNLRASVQDPTIDNAKLASRVTQVPCTSLPEDTRPATCSFIAFTLMIPIHMRLDVPTYDFIPLPFFKTQQLVCKNSPHTAAFGRSVHRRFSPIIDSSSTNTTLFSPGRVRKFISVPGYLLFSRTARSHADPLNRPYSRRGDGPKFVSASRDPITLKPCGESVSSLLETAGSGRDSDLVSDRKAPSEISELAVKTGRRQQQPAKGTYGGIMVSQEVTVDVEKATETTNIVPDIPSATHQRDSSLGAVKLVRQKSQRGLSNATHVDDGQNSPEYGQDMELTEVKTALGMGLTRVEVKKGGDDTITTFVDDLFAICIDTPRRL